MKKMILTGLVAMALAAVSGHYASAWFKFGLGGSFNTGMAWGGHNLSFNCQSAECCYPMMAPAEKVPAPKPDGKPAGKPETSVRPAVWQQAPAYQPIGYTMPSYEAPPIHFPNHDFYIGD